MLKELKENKEIKTLVAVYGTLKKGRSNHYLIEDAEFVGSGSTLPNFSMVSFGGYPGVVNGVDKVHCEVYSVDPTEMRHMDSLEGHPHFYQRNPTTISMDDGEVEAWMYTLCHNNDRYTDRPKVPVNANGLLEW